MHRYRTFPTLLLLLIILSVLALSRSSWFANVSAARLTTANTMDRLIEPVVTAGAFSGVATNELFVYRYLGGKWEQIPFQIDERNADGSYTTSENGVMDENDEVVFMSGDLGDQGDLITSPITPSLTSKVWYKIEVSNPITPSLKGWAYIVHSAILTPTNTTDYISYTTTISGTTPGLPGIISSHYTLGWAKEGHNGNEYLSLFGGPNMLDRTKIRVAYRLLDIVPLKLTENDLLLQPLILEKDGPVRAIIKRGVARTFAYQSLFVTVTALDLNAVPGTVDEVRISTDMTASVTATYYDENNPNGLLIDGNPDTSTTTLVQAWRQTTHNSGVVIQVIDLKNSGGTRVHYYKDDSTADNNDTGDKQSWGDSGFALVGSAANPIQKQVSYTNSQYILPATERSNQGVAYYVLTNNPLLVSATAETLPLDAAHIYLPTILNSR